MEIIHGNENNFQDLIKDDLVVVDFFATWCGPCKMLASELETMQEDRNDFKIVKIDVDENEKLAQKYGIMSVPTLLLFKKGDLVSTQNGFIPKDNLLEWVNNNK